MQNLSDVATNGTWSRSVSIIVKVCVVIPFFSVFLCCIFLMLHTFASHRHFLESSRHVLFAYMLVNDALQLLTSVLLFLFAIGGVNFAIVYCAPLLFVSTATFLNSPLILATMCLERYVAIFWPLRRPAPWRADRVWAIALSLWAVSCVLPAVDFVLFRPRPGWDPLATPVACKTSVLNASPVQTLFKVALNGFFFAAVAALILFTYVRILLETRAMRQDRASVAKALHTVVLHGLQLLLSLTAFTLPVTEQLVAPPRGFRPEDVTFLNYFCFVLIPRFLSPLIYGLRDERLRADMRRVLQRCASRVAPGDKDQRKRPPLAPPAVCTSH
ncbi:odorant receptor 129-1 [Denticeps clupeoides]|uniref:odorant receptor 129-1 n=1 Tax=Denticeps clupeoides TaxID=299321 RepID=UPI0010A394BA|nr:odorant receptor 131-2-like [Denticeps clupeoides]